MSVQGELAVHKRKVEEVRQWLVEAFEGGPSGKLKKYRVSHSIEMLVYPEIRVSLDFMYDIEYVCGNRAVLIIVLLFSEYWHSPGLLERPRLQLYGCFRRS